MTGPVASARPHAMLRSAARIGMPSSDISLADAARDRRDWMEAARLYRQALARGRDRADLLVQLGHCLKEAGRHGAAFEAYRRALQADPTDPDPPLHLAHLLKVSGNPAAARRLYGRATRLGSADARAELDAAAEPGRWPAPRLATGTPPAPARAMACRLACAEADPAPARLLEDAVVALVIANQCPAARACLHLAAILQGVGEPVAHHRLGLHAAALGTSWPSLPAGPGSHPDARSLLRGLVRAAVADAAPAPASSGPPAPRNAETPGAHDDAPEAPSREGNPDLLDFLAALHAGLAAAAAGDGAALAGPMPERLRAWAGRPLQATHPADADHVVADPAGVAALASTAWRVAHNLAVVIAGDLLPLLDPAATGLGAAVAGVLVRGISGCPPLYLLAPRGPAGLPGFDPDHVEDLVAALLPDGAGDAARTAHADRVAAALTRTLDRDEALAMACRVAERGWVRAARLAASDWVRAGSTARDRDTLLARGRALKHAGAWQDAKGILEQLRAAHPEDEDVLAELAITQKTCGDFAGAVASLEALLARKPGDAFAEREMLGILPEVLGPKAAAAWVEAEPRRRRLAGERLLYRPAPATAAVDPALAMLPRGMLAEAQATAMPAVEERIEILQLGWLRSADGSIPRLAGICAVRVRVLARVPIVALRIRLSGQSIARLEAQAGSRPPGTPAGWHAAIFNAWIDVSGIPDGRHELQLYVEEISSGYRTLEQAVEVGGPVPAAAASDALVPGPVPARRRIEDHVNALPSMVRSARRGLSGAPATIRRVLILRADQLGDVVASIPAMRRLRAILPDARFYGLATPAARDLMAGLGFFEEVASVALAYDHRTKRRHLATAEALRLRAQLAAWRIDLAVDLSPGIDTRPLLRLSGAPCTAGFKPREFPWLSFGMETVSRDAVNGRECMSHQAMVSGFVEALGVALCGTRDADRQMPVQPVRLAAAAGARQRLGIPPGARLAVLHAGARLDFKRWPAAHFARLAQLATEAVADLHVLLLADGPLPEVAAMLSGRDRIRLLEGQLPFADLEALLATSSVFVGNDTGPKHLAAHLGAPVVSLHMGQVNWSEWGQEGDGEILSRRVPCCGCGIEDSADCGQALACLTQIRPEEVLAAMLRRLRSATTAAEAAA